MPSFNKLKGYGILGLYGLLGLATLLCFTPLAYTVIVQASQHEQLHHAALILVFAVIALLIEEKNLLKIQICAERRFYLWIFTAFFLLGIGHLLNFAWINGVAFALILSAWLGFFYGESIYRVGNAFSLAFIFFLTVAEVFNYFDWPLRTMAGVHAAWVLNHLGIESSLHLNSTNITQLILKVSGRPFEVASECNGYGLITSSALVALLVVSYKKMFFFDRCLSVILALFLGSLFNTIRILIIILLAPHVGDSYHLMHEIVGTFFFWFCLILIWFLVKGFREQAPKTTKLA